MLSTHAQWQVARTEAVMSTLVSSRSDRETVDESELVEDDESVMLLYIPELCSVIIRKCSSVNI